MRFVSRYVANKWVFNAELKMSMLSVGSRSVRKRVPDHRSCNRERSTSELAATVSWHDHLTPVGWPQALTTGNVRHTQQPTKYWGSTILEAPINIVTPSLYWTRWWMSSQCSSEWSRSDKLRSNSAIHPSGVGKWAVFHVIRYTDYAVKAQRGWLGRSMPAGCIP